MAPWAAIFDWDGVILDSSRQHEAAWKQLAVEKSHPLPQGFFARSFGMKNDQVIRDLLAWPVEPEELERLSLRKEVIFRELIAGEKLRPLPGVVAWLDKVAAAEVPCAVASSTPRRNIECIIDQLGVRRFFRAMVCAEDVRHGKPDPEVFLLAANQLGARPARCVVFEDAHVGIEAARAAGMRVIAVASTHPAASLQAADHVTPRLDDLSLEMIAAWFAPAAA